MNWFRQNKFLGSFLVAFALGTLLAGAFLLHEKSAADEEQTRLESTLNELNRLRSSKPYPNAANLQKTKAQAATYRASLGGLENELKARTLPLVPLQPNEFQTQLRDAVIAVTEAAAANKIKLPSNFYLGFDEYATSLPNSTAAPLLGQELHAIAMLAGWIVDAHVDALTSFTRTPLPEEKPAASLAPAQKRGARPAKATAAAAAHSLLAARAIDITFSASPAAARKVLNQVATAKEQLFIIRVLNVKNQVDKGPPRGAALAAEAAPPAAATPGRGGAAPPPPSIHFIVGGEHLDVKARIEIISLNADKETR